MKSKMHPCPSTYVSDWKVLLEPIQYAPNVETRLVLPISWKLVNPLVHFSTGTTRKRMQKVPPHHPPITTFACQTYDRIHRSCPRSFHSNHRLIFHVINFWWFKVQIRIVIKIIKTHSFPTLILQHISKWLISLFVGTWMHLVGKLNS